MSVFIGLYIMQNMHVYHSLPHYINYYYTPNEPTIHILIIHSYSSQMINVSEIVAIINVINKYVWFQMLKHSLLSCLEIQEILRIIIVHNNNQGHQTKYIIKY